MRIAPGLAATLVLGLVVVAAPTAAPDTASQSRLVDRSFLCAPRLIRGGRVVDIRVAYPVTVSSSPFPGITVSPAHYPGYVSVNTGQDAPDYQLVYVVSRPSSRSLRVNFLERPGVFVHARRCAPSRTTVPLSSKGLPRPPARWTTDTTCVLKERVSIHVRASLQSPAPWGPVGGGFVGARRYIVNARVAIRGEKSGRPIAYFEMDTAGKTSLWASPTCR